MDPSDFDMKAKNAAENNFSPFEEASWDKMALLLDKHLPLKKERRGFMFWWLIALMPIGLFAGYLLINNYIKRTNEKHNYTITQIRKQSANTPIQNPVPVKNRMVTDSSLIVKKEDKTIDVLSERLQVADQKNDLPVKRFHKKEYKRSAPSISNSNLETAPQIATINHKDDNDIASQNENHAKENNAKAENKFIASLKDTVEKKLNINNVVSKTDTKRKKIKGQFYLTISSGIESSGTTFNSLGAARPLNGVGIQYAKNKIFLRAGMFLSKKLYSAKDKDYNRKSGSWMSVVTFDNIVANCKVIEIPISMGFTFMKNKKTAVYITAGTSAYFMKKEDYQFHFKTTSGNDTTRNANFTNNSNHYFSSINFSAGIEKKMSNRVSLMAEPTVKIPVSGIGFGKIKLYGVGVLVTAKIKLK